MKIGTLSLSKLHAEEHLQIMFDSNNNVAAFLVDNAEAMTPMADLMTDFTTLLTKEDQALKTYQKSMLTDPIADKDKQRDFYTTGLRYYVKAYSYSIIEAEVEAARRIQIIIDNYGDYRRKPYKEETATIYNLLQDLRDNLSAELTTIKADKWVDMLEELNQEMDSLMGDRFDEKATRPDFALEQVRKEIDLAYNDMIDAINVFANFKGGEVYDPLIRRQNEIVDYYRTVLAQRKGRNEAKKKEEGGTIEN